jgi:hypothetical protein
VKEEYKRANFKEILDILDPDMTVDFKQNSFYHNDYKTRLMKKKNLETEKNNSVDFLTSVHILDPIVGNSDNYM